MPMPQKPESNSLFSKESTAEVGAVQVQKWTTGDKPRLAGAVMDQLGKNCTNNSLLRELNGLAVDREIAAPQDGLERDNRDGRLTAGKELLRP